MAGRGRGFGVTGPGPGKDFGFHYEVEPLQSTERKVTFPGDVLQFKRISG